MFRLTILTVCAFGALATKFRYDNFQVYEVFAKSVDDVELIHSLEDNDEMELDFWQEGGRNIPAHIMVSPSHRQQFLDTLNTIGLEHKLMVPDVQKQIDDVDEKIARIPRSARSVNNTYYHYDENIVFLEGLLADHSEHMSMKDYGTTINGRRLFYVKLSGDSHSHEDPSESKKPVIWIEATTHAREWITNAVSLNMIKWLLENYGHDSTAIAMLDEYDWFFVPIHNPDGYDYTKTHRLWRKSRSNSGCTTGDGANGGNGVDTNRNWGFQWRSSSSRCSITYSGTSAWTERENDQLKDIINKTPSQHRLGFFSLHSYSQLILTPYGYSTSADVPNYSEQLRVANAARQAIIDNNGPAFIVGKPGHILYNAYGIASDWAYGSAGFTYSFTYELHPATSSGGGFILPPEEILSSYLDIFASFVALAKEMQYDGKIN